MSSYSRPWKSFEEQLHLLKSRGLEVTDDQAALEYLDRLGYYRLSAYWYPLRQFRLETDKKSGKITVHRLNEFCEGAKFEDVVNFYVFDKRLRLLALDALERIEVAIRVDIAYRLGKRDTFAYLESSQLDSNFVTRIRPKSGTTKHGEWLEKYERILGRSRETFVKHYMEKYGPPLPFWVAIEIWDFGLLSWFFSGMKNSDQQFIAKKYGVLNGRVFESWFRSMNYLRNLCAHHSRVWNRNMIDQPKLTPAGQIPDFDRFIGKADLIARPFLLFCILQSLMKQISPTSSWGDRFKQLMASFPTSASSKVGIADMGCIDGWETWDLWS